MNNPTTPRVALVYHLLPHYREPVLRLLSESKDIEYHFLADPKGEAGIRPIPRDHLPRTHDLTNRWVGPFLFQQGLFSTLRRVRPDVVIFHADYRYLTTWLNAVILRASGKRVIFWTQGWRRPESGPRASVRRAFYRIADHLLVYGSRARQIGIAAGFSPDRITAIGNSHITAEDLASVPTHRIEADALRIGAVMRLVPNKKVTQLAEIAASLTRTGTPTHVHIAGDGPDAVALTAACAAAGVPLRSYGAIHSPDELADYYAELDICVIPGAAGLSVLQALAHGRPVVTHDSMGIQGPEVEALIRGKTGSLVPQDDVDAFAQAIAGWAERVRSDGEAVAAACVANVTRGWVADRQAEYITREIQGADRSAIRVAVINPNARKDQYSGPNVFMDRLFSHNADVSATIVTGSADAEEAFQWANVAIPTPYDRSGRIAQVRWSLALARWLWRNARRFDAVHAHGIYLYNLLPLRAAQMRAVPVILVPLGENAELRFVNRGQTGALSRLRRSVISRAALGLGLSRKIEAELIRAGMAREHVAPIGNPVDTETFTPPDDDRRFSQRVVGFVGVIGDRKGGQVVLQALSLLRAQPGFGEVRGLFVGPYSDDDYEQTFVRYTQDLGLDEHVQVTGYTTEVASFMHQMSVFVLPSNQEGLPGALVEGMAAGLPAVVTDVGAMGDVVRDADCGHVTDRDARALARSLADVLASEAEWSRLSNNARRHALQHFSTESVQLAYNLALNKI